MTDTEAASANGIEARYEETDGERRLTFSRDGREATVAQNADGYAMLKIRTGPDGDELERYYGFDMALDHAAELLGAVGVLVPGLRGYAGWGLLLLLLAVFPANVHMALHPAEFERIPAWVLYLRLPLQFVLMGWIYWALGLGAPSWGQPR